MHLKVYRSITIWVVIMLVLAACRLPGQIATPTAVPTPQPTTTENQPSPAPTATQATVIEATPTSAPTATARLAGSELPPFPAGTPLASAENQLNTWHPTGKYVGLDYALPVALTQTTNPAVTSGLTRAQQEFLQKNGFVVIRSQEEQFNDIREDVALRTGQPYFLTTDAAYHALHITFEEMLKALEAQYLSRQMRKMVQATLQETLSYLPLVKGTSIEGDTRLAVAYLAVALKLLEPDAGIPPEVEAPVKQQVDQIMAGGGTAPSILIPGFQDDYGAYKPVGHYAGRPRLEAYFRAMTWLGRVHFQLKSSGPDLPPPSRAPLIITLALRQAKMDDQTAAQAWADVNELLTYLVGPSDDSSPREYAALMDQVYGTNATVQDLADNTRWQQFQERSAELPSPKINSTFVTSLDKIPGEKGWRLMGQRFTLDGMVFQNLVFNKVGTRENPRKLPKGLDVAAAFGSPLAMKILEETGETSYQNYPQQMAMLQQKVQAQPEAEWLGTFYSTWLYAFFPQFTVKDASFPGFMQTSAWGVHELNSVLGSWAQLKHDTVLYAKMPEGMGGGGPPMSGPAPAYVEANPNVFYRLGYTARLIGSYFTQKIEFEGLALDDPLSDDYLRDGLDSYATGLNHLGETFIKLGDIAAKELAGQLVTADDYDLIQGCLGPVECLVFRTHTPYSEGEVKLPPVPVVAAVYGVEDNILEAAVGKVDRIFVVVPLEGKLQVAQGGVFSYYELLQPRSDRLTDDDWRARLNSNPPERPEWASQFSLAGGKPASVLAFRVGDIYIITEAGDQLNLRELPNKSARIITRFRTGDYIEIIEGPRMTTDGHTWWKVRSAMDPTIEGWVAENQDWYKRSTILKD